jgi:chromosome segregation ATPase
MKMDKKEGWHKLNYHQRGERIAELESLTEICRKEMADDANRIAALQEELDDTHACLSGQTDRAVQAEARLETALRDCKELEEKVVDLGLERTKLLRFIARNEGAKAVQAALGDEDA